MNCTDKLNDMQAALEVIKSFAMVLKESLYNSGGMDAQHATAAAYVAEEIYKKLDDALEAAEEIEEELLTDGDKPD